MTYSTGDYLAILPTNPAQSVRRVLKHFNLSEEVSQTLKGGYKHLKISSAGYCDN
jgi:cytochrome P450/NADPH-cytochrome P450 reductase